MKAATARVSAIVLMLGFMLVLTGCSPTIVLTFNPDPVRIYENQPIDVSVTLTIKGVGANMLDKVGVRFYDSTGQLMQGFEGNQDFTLAQPIPVIAAFGMIPPITRTLKELNDGQDVYAPEEVWQWQPSALPASVKITFYSVFDGQPFGSGQASIEWYPAIP